MIFLPITHAKSYRREQNHEALEGHTVDVVMQFFAGRIAGSICSSFAARLHSTDVLAGTDRQYSIIYFTDNSDRCKKSTKNRKYYHKTVPSVTPLSETSDGYQDGTYTGTGTGFSGPITVQVVIQDGKITEITILNTTDDSPYIENASALLKTIIATQSTMWIRFLVRLIVRLV